MERYTQTESYWKQFKVTEEDIDRIYNLLMEASRPVETERLARVVMEGRIRDEERRLQDILSKGRVYRPKETYNVGDTLVFPALDYAVGTVVGKRAGHNPAYPDFQVIQVQLEGEETPREFASGLDAPHRLNDNGDVSALTGGLSVDDIFSKYGHFVVEALEQDLRKREDDFVYIEGGWFLRDSLAEIHIGHLNIAEAVIDLRGEPVTLDEILKELELPEEIPLDVQRLSLAHALRQDERYVSVDVNGEIRWYLRRFLPPALAEEPRLLRYEPVPYRRDSLTLSLLQLEWELDDEWSDTEEEEESVGTALVPSATLVLIYPHWRYGTIPMTSRVRHLLPPVRADVAMITLVDGRWGERFTGWISPAHRLIAGLDNWYQKHKISVGAYIIVERKVEEPGTYIVDFHPRRPKREQVRTARIKDGKVTFELSKQEVVCETDEHVLLAVADTQAFDEYVASLPDPLPPLQETVDALFPELAELNPQKVVHAKTLYSAVNLVRRCPPGPVFAVLAESEKYEDVGDGQWVERH